MAAARIRITHMLMAFVLCGGLAPAPVGASTPWAPQPPLTAAADGKAFDALGWSVGTSGNTVIVGAKSDDVSMFRSGAAYVFVRSGATWTRQARLTASDAGVRDLFGSAVAVSGDTAIVGALGANSNLGQAYIFVRSGTTWTQQQIVKADVSVLGDLCGYSVAISGDTALLGCRNNGNGAVYVFVRSGGVWTQQAKLPNAESGDYFAFSIGLSGNTAIVGALADKAGAPQAKGAATVFVRSGTTWSVQQKLIPADGLAGDRFGYSVGISGDTVLVGSNNASVRQGAYVYVRSGATWSQQAKLVADDLMSGDGFGQSVAIGGNIAVVGAVEDDLGGAAGTNEGSAYRFERNGTGWTQKQKFTASDAANNAAFGFAVAASDTLAVVGSPALKVGANSTQGEAYAFSNADLDDDGLPDEWERNGVTLDGVFIDLPKMGANPLHKDLFVHADWMGQDPARPAVVFKPDPRAVKIVIDSFAIAPVTNPDQRKGVTLHVDLGPTSLMRPGAQWGAFSKAGEVPFQDELGSTDIDTNAYSWIEFDAVKALKFDPAKRKGVFRYALFGNQLTGQALSGLARGGSTDFAVTLGTATRIAGGSVHEQAGTFMHELGHSLGLLHGGGDPVQTKPNYLSIMSYRFQLVGVVTPTNQRAFDYSRRKLPDLDESNLDENVGIADPDLHPTWWNVLTAPDASNKCQDDPNGYYKLLPKPALDWNCDGAKTASPVHADVNGDAICVTKGEDDDLTTTPAGDDEIRGEHSIVAGANGQCETAAAANDEQRKPVGFIGADILTGFNDWPAVDFGANGLIGAAGTTATDPMSTVVEEPSGAEILEGIPPALLDEQLAAPLDVVTASTTEGPAPLLVGFNGSASTAVTGTIASWAWDFGDGTTGTGATVQHTYDTPGEYFASVTITDTNGHVNLVPLLTLITVNEASPATPTPTVTATVLATPSRTATRTPTPAQTPGTGVTATTGGTGATTTTGQTSGPGATPTTLPTATPTQQVGDVDLTFEATATSRDGEVVNAILTQPDGKVIVAGDFESYGGCARRNIARLATDGSCDPSFDPGLALTEVFHPSHLPPGADIRRSLAVYALALQPDGKVLVGVQAIRSLKAGESAVSKVILRLDADGARDASFDATAFDIPATEPRVNGIAVQPDGKIIVVGDIRYGANGKRSGVARLNADGSLDPAFISPPGTFWDGPTLNVSSRVSVSAVALQSNGKIVIAGLFNAIGPTTVGGIARLEIDGSVDTAFNLAQAGGPITGLGFGTSIFAIRVQPDGKLVVAGAMYDYPSDARLVVARLAADGSRDAGFATTFGANSFGSNTAGASLALQPDGKVVVAGYFQSTSPALRHSIARLNDDGTLDLSFDTGTGMSGHRRHNGVYAVARQADGKIVVAGNFDTYDGAVAEGIVQLEQDGSRDPSFISNGAGQNSRVYALARQPDGKLLVGFYPDGTTMKLNETQRGGIGRLNADGTTDPTFTSPFAPEAAVDRILLQPDGKILLNGTFRLVGAVSEIHSPRLNADGTLDPTFNAVGLLLAVQADGKIFASMGIPFSNATELVRLDSDGSRDATFTPHFFPNGGADRLTLQPDGRMLITGQFFLADGRPAGIARLEADGTFDPTFDPGTGPNGTLGVGALVLQSDGKIIIGGFGNSYDGVPHPALIARLNPNGSLDGAFTPVNPNNRTVGALALQPDGKLVVGIRDAGDSLSLLSPIRVFRLDTDGQLDPSFPITNAGIEPVVGAVNAMVLQPDGAVVIGGNFEVVNGVARLGLARLLGPTVPATLDHFVFYKVKPSKGTPKLAPLGPITLADAVATGDVDVQKLVALGLPADTDAADAHDPSTQLADYAVKLRKSPVKFRPLVDVRVRNACSDLIVTLKKPEHLLAPALLDLSAPVLAPDAATHQVADFRCYAVKVQKKRADGSAVAGFPKGVQIAAGDRFQSRRYDLKKLTRLCYPVAESGAPMILKTGAPVPFTPAALRHASVHLACYQAKAAKKTIAQNVCGPIDPKDKGTKIVPPAAKHEKRLGVQVASQLGPGTLDTAKEVELCIPSTVSAP